MNITANRWESTYTHLFLKKELIYKNRYKDT